MKEKNTTAWRAILPGTLLFVLLLSLLPSIVQAYAVPALPAGNLVTNPWFRNPSDPTQSGLNGWTDSAGLNKYWSSSQKESNPSPDAFISGVCGNQLEFCGTGARLSWRQGQSGGLGIPNVDSYLYQVVSANASHKTLKFSTYWVAHAMHIAEVTILGGSSPNGPWMSLWTPFTYNDTSTSSEQDLWDQTDLVEKTITNGYPYYKIQVHAKLTDDIQTGFKITGVYFTTQATTNTPMPATPTIKPPRPGLTQVIPEPTNPPQQPTATLLAPEKTRPAQDSRKR